MSPLLDIRMPLAGGFVADMLLIRNVEADGIKSDVAALIEQRA